MGDSLFEKIYINEKEKAIRYIQRKLDGKGGVEVAEDLFSDSIMTLKERYLDTGGVKEYTNGVKLLYGIISRGGIAKYFRENQQSVSLTVFDEDDESRTRDFSDESSITNNQIFYTARHLKELEYQRAYMKKWYPENKWRYERYAKNRTFTPEQIRNRNIVRLIRYYKNKRSILKKMAEEYKRKPEKYKERVRKYQTEHSTKKKKKKEVLYWLKDSPIPPGYHALD